MRVRRLVAPALALLLGGAVTGMPSALAAAREGTSAPHRQVAAGQTPRQGVAANQTARPAEASTLPRELGLSEAVELALRYNLGLQTSRLDPEIAAEAVVGAAAPFDTRFNLNLVNPLQRQTVQSLRQIEGGRVTTTDMVGVGGQVARDLEWGTQMQLSWNTNRSASSDPFRNFNPNVGSTLNLSVTQPLLEGFGARINRRPIIVAEHGYESSREGFRQQVQQTLLQTYTAYWNMVLARQTLQVREQALQRARQELERNRMQVDLGTRRPLDLVQTQTQVANAEVNLAAARTQLEDRQDDLRQLINAEAVPGLGWETDLLGTDEPRQTIETPDLEAAVERALANDPDLVRERINLRSRQLDLQVARNRMLPGLDLAATLNLRGEGGDEIIRDVLGGEVIEIQEGGFGDSLRRLFSGDFNAWSVRLTMNFPLHNWEARAGHAQSVLQEQQVRLRIADLEQQVRTRVRQSLRQVESQAEQLEAARRRSRSAELQLRAAELQLEMGSGDIFQTLDFQNDLTDAQTAELQALVALNIAWARLEADQGTLIESLGIDLRQAGRGGVAR